MKRNFVINLSLIVGLLVSSFGVSYAYESGFDLAQSSLSITYDDLGKPGVPQLSCFGDSGPSIIMTFQALGLSPTWEREITECFQQAGIYTVQIDLQDLAGNQTSKTFTIEIKPDQIDFNQSPLTTLQDPPTAEEPTANNRDYFRFTIFLRDALGNPIDQINSGRISSVSTFPDDANTGLSFRDGLRINETDLLPLVDPGVDNLSDGDVTDGISFSLSALAPSLKKAGPKMGVLYDRDLVLEWKFPQILPNGSLDTDNHQSHTENHNVRYHPLFVFAPTLPQYIFDEEPTIIDVDVTAHGAITTGPTPTPERPTSVMLSSPTEADFQNQDLNNAGYDLMNAVTAQLPLGAIGGLQLGVMTHIYGRVNTDVNVMTEITYDYQGETIVHPSYAAGALGEPLDPEECVEGDPLCDPCAILGLEPDCDPCALEGINCTPTPIGFIGASFETPVIKSQNRGVLDQNDTQNITVFYDLSQKTNQVRDRMRNQLFELVSGVTPQTCPGTGFISFETTGTDDLQEVFLDQDVVLVQDCNVEIASPAGTKVTLPSGQKTLVVRNGNIRIENDMGYGGLNDSFGFILVNEETQNYPATSNLFIKDTVHHFVGNYFLDGALFSTAGGVLPTVFLAGNPRAVIDDVAGTITNGMNNDLQLILMGTILSYNTIGGKLEKYDYDRDAYADLSSPKYYFTPWHVFLDPENDTPVAGITSEVLAGDLAIKYDLHYMRQYRLSEAMQDDGLGNQIPWKCALKPGSLTECDANPNAFIIRNDQRVVQNPPPGFEGLNVLNLGQ